MVIDLHMPGESMVIVGNGCAGAECIKALRESGYKEKIDLLTDNRWPVANPMLTTYYVAGKIDFERLFPYGASEEITHFMGMDFVGIGDVELYDRTEEKHDGKRYIQLFWKDGLLTGANLLDSFTESGVVKHALMKGLRYNGSVLSDSVPLIQNQLIKNILLEVQKT